ncbi:MAG: amino acid ABC transporter substrate-binding protein [Deltaproteobacteria bacterium]|nr:amino acid ABC transporter substrate-binding protein [Deltaproteobacteria bacterium]
MGSKALKLTMVSAFFVFLFNQSVFSLSIGTVEEPPGNFSEKGIIKGLSVDFVKEIQKRVNDKTKIKILPGSRLIKLSLTKKNYVVFSLSRTKAREDKYHWISLVMRKPLVMFAKKGSNLNIKNLNDAKKVKSIGVMRRSVQHDFLTNNNFKNIQPVTSHDLNLKKIMAGRITLTYHSMQGMAALCKKLGVDFNNLEPVLILQISKSSIAMSKRSDISVVKRWQDAAIKIKKDGVFKNLAKKWAKYTKKTLGIDAEVKNGALNFWKEK